MSIEGTEVVQDQEMAMETEGHVDVTSQGGLSFDELESLEASEKVEARREAQKEAEKEKAKAEIEKSEEKPGKQAKKDKEPKKQAKEESTGEEKEASPERGDEESEEKQEASEEPKKVRTFKVKSGDSEVALRSDTKFTVKSDGEKQEVELQDLMNSWSGHKAVDRRYSEFDVEKKKFVEERSIVDNTVSEVAEDFNEGNLELVVTKLAGALGGKPEDALQKLNEMVFERAQQIASLSEEQQVQYKEQLQADQYKSLYEAEVKAKESQQALAQIDDQVSSLTQQYGVSDSEFDRVANELFDLKEQGKFQSEINPQTVVQVCLYDRKLDAARGVLKGIDNELVADREAVEKVMSFIDAGLDKEEVRELALKKFKPTKSQEQILSEKVIKSEAKDKVTQTTNPSKEDMWSFDQM